MLSRITRNEADRGITRSDDARSLDMVCLTEPYRRRHAPCRPGRWSGLRRRQQILEQHAGIRQFRWIRMDIGFDQLAALDIILGRVDAVERDHPPLLEIDDREAAVLHLPANHRLV